MGACERTVGFLKSVREAHRSAERDYRNPVVALVESFVLQIEQKGLSMAWHKDGGGARGSLHVSMPA